MITLGQVGQAAVDAAHAERDLAEFLQDNDYSTDYRREAAVFAAHDKARDARDLLVEQYIGERLAAELAARPAVVVSPDPWASYQDVGV